MINIHIQERYKSLTHPLQISLPDFTVISGINGGGKSHFLSAIAALNSRITDENGAELSNRRLLTTQLLIPADQYSVSRESLVYDYTNIEQVVRTYLQQKAIAAYIDINNFAGFSFSQKYIIKRILSDSGIPIERLSIEDIKDYYPIAVGNTSDMFQQNFSNLFKKYLDKFEENIYFKYLNEVEGIPKRYLDQHTFIQRHGEPPWEFINNIFEESNIDYYVNNPVANDRDLPFHFKLINKTNKAEVPFSDLSSGEKILISLTFAIYNSKFDFDFPDVLLLDELDAHLHPSMANQLIRVVEEVLVKQKGIKVIMTTHSPSTVALAPESSLYIMQRQDPRVQKKTKEWVMKLLTEGIPSFSIYTDNTKQVFVESQVDVDFYTKLYNKVKRDIPSDKSLYFISSGVVRDNTGNSSQVKMIVDVLTKNGNKTVYGIVDWDMKNSKKENVFVLGENMRYSIENYILDPIILISFLLREKIVTRESVGIGEKENYFDFPKFTQSKIQSIVDLFLGDFLLRSNFSISDNTLAVVYYHGALSLSLPNWYLFYQGHQLEDLLRKAYPKLNKFKDLKMEIIDKVIDDLPEFISLDIITLFQMLQNAY